MKRSSILVAALVGALPLFTGCRSAYYGAMETFGVHKRDILVDKVEEGRDAQQAAKEQFQDALEAFRAVQDFEGGKLEKLYSGLKDELEDSEARVETVHSRIDAIETVASDLFSEWKQEIGTIESADLRRKSETLLRDTRRRYDELISAMKQAESRMEPVLVAFRDHVTFLKHNLNAQAIASLQGSLGSIEDDVAVLIRDMEASIAEADSFIATMEGEGKKDA